MEEECVIVDETSGTGTTPPQKKMKQSRLPFTPLQGKSPQTVGKQLKRKLSNSDLVDCKSPKTPRSDADSTSKNKNPVETELSDIKDTKDKERTKDVIETNDVQEETKSEKKEEVQDNLRKRGRTPASKNKTPAKSTPSKETKKEKENTEDGNDSLVEEQENKPKKRGRPTSSSNTPAKTPGKATPTDKTPGKATPGKATPGKATPGKATPLAKTPGKATPSAKTVGKATPTAKTPGKTTPSAKTPGKATPGKATPAKATPAKTTPAKTPGKATPSTKTPGKATPAAKTPGKSTPAKTPVKATPSGKKTGKAAPSEVKKAGNSEESEKQENGSNENETSSKDKDDSTKKVSGLLQKLPSVSDDESEELDENKGEKSDSIEDKSNIEKLDGKEDLLKDGSKKRKTTEDEILVSNGSSKTVSEESQSKTKMEDTSLKKKSRNSLDAFVKKGAEAMALKEKVSDSIKTPKSTNKSQSSVESKSPESVDSDDTKNPLASPKSIIPKKLTPGQLAKETERLKKKEEREKEREEKLKQKQKEIDEKNKLKEDEKKKKEEEREKEKKQKEEERLQKEEEKRQKNEEKEQQRKELEKEKEEKKRLKQEAIDAKLKEKEELQLKKEAEKKLQEEEKKLQEEEELRQKEQAKAKFSSFFVAKKVTPVAIPKEKKNDYFCQFQVKNNMKIAPVTRHQLANQHKEKLDKYISGKKKESKENLFVNAIKSPAYIKGTSARTYPPQEQKEEEEENDCEVIEEEDADGIGEAVVTSESVPIDGKTIERRKVLKFCENNRPPYRGTWRKKTKYITGRHPFRKDEDCFNYDYDSDDDWEEEANGENLSDCEDEKDEEEEKKTEAENDYEVDNDFFVPHGYLSDDEGKSDQEEMENEMEVDDEKDTKKKKEQLKQKQTEFENEIKQKTRQLKPRVFGCLWMSEETTNKAYDQLLKVLNPYRAVVCCSAKLPIATTYSKVKPKDASKEVNESSQDGDDAAGASQGAQKFVKNFPEEVVPPLIKLLHCNRNSKVFLGKEFVEYWKKNSEEGLEDSLASKHGLLAKAKIEAKICDLKATWGKNAEEGENAKHMMWTVPLEVREKYGLSELPSTNTWTYILTPKEKKTKEDGSEDPSDDPKTPRNNKKDSKTNNTKDSKTPKITDSKTPKITAFAKKCSPGSSNTFSKTPSGTPTAGSTKGSTPKTPKTPSEAQSTTGSKKELFTKVTSEQSAANTPSKTPKSSIANFFKKKVDKESPKDGDDKVNSLEKNGKNEESEKSDVITLE